jgi:prophage regulatory protein
MPKKPIDRSIAGADSVFDWDAAVRIAKEHLLAQYEPERILRLPEVEKLIGLKKSSIYEMVAQERFPPPVQLTAKAVGWKARDIAEWIKTRV